MIRPIQIVFTLAIFAFCNSDSGLSQETDRPNQIVRVEPGPIARQIGNAVRWETSWERAVAKSRESGKPIFWYVPTVPGTFMDRKIEIDRYMLAGPFSWPPIIELLNDRFVPYRKVPSKTQAEQLNLRPYEFVEPGFVILNAEQKIERKVDHLTTLHPIWMAKLIAGDSSFDGWGERGILADAWNQFQSGDYNASVPELKKNDPAYCESLLLRGMFAFRQGDHAVAQELWRRAAAAAPDAALGWKAAAEAEGIGPFIRGMETWEALPDGAWQAGIDSIGSAAPEGVYDESEMWHRSVRFLLGMQADNGGFFDSDYDFGGYDSLPNVHAAVTSICGMALLAARERVTSVDRQQIDDAIARAAAFVVDPKNHNPADRDEILWSYAYRVRFLSRLLAHGFGDAAENRKHLDTAVRALESIQLNNGRWYHEYTNPFVTGTALAALFAAKSQGAQPDPAKVAGGIKTLMRDRFENGAYPYFAREDDGNAEQASIEASAGRMAICELALWYWQQIDDAQLAAAAQISLKHHPLLFRAYKYDNHTSTYAYGGFFFWYDMRARAELISRIRDDQLRQRLAAEHRELILKLPEVDGCFVDSHELGRCYGSAMALLSLEHLAAEFVDVNRE